MYYELHHSGTSGTFFFLIPSASFDVSCKSWTALTGTFNTFRHIWYWSNQISHSRWFPFRPLVLQQCCHLVSSAVIALSSFGYNGVFTRLISNLKRVTTLMLISIKLRICDRFHSLSTNHLIFKLIIAWFQASLSKHLLKRSQFEITPGVGAKQKPKNFLKKQLKQKRNKTQKGKTKTRMGSRFILAV